MKRVIVYGDLHGCLDELKALRDKLDIQTGDIEISVGDIVNKGSYLAHDMVEYLKTHHFKAVMGNNEAKALKQYNKYQKQGESYLKTLRPFEIATVLSMQKEDYTYMASLPYFLKINNLTVLHGGLLPGLRLSDTLDDTQKKELTLLRYVNKKLEPIAWSDQENRYKFWTEIYDGSEGFIVAGHHPFPDPKVDKYAMDIDTGCVYGGALTAAVFIAHNNKIDTKKYHLVSQKAYSDYWNTYLKPD